MTNWADSLDRLASSPRENGTAELQATADWLLAELHRRGVAAVSWAYEAQPYKLRLVGAVCLISALLYIAALLRGKSLLAILVVLSSVALLALEIDYGVNWVGSVVKTQQQNIVATVHPAQPAQRRLIFSAHYDTKTDVLDHVERTPLVILSLPLTLLMLAGAWKPKHRKLRRAAVIAAAFNGCSFLLTQTAGAFWPWKSPGAIDNGAACAVLLELGTQLKGLSDTEVQLIFFSGEEIALQGSRAYVKSLSKDLPTQVVNLDGIGESSSLMLFKAEAGLMKSYKPDTKLVSQIEQVAELNHVFYPATTDARAFLEHGIPAVNLASDRPGHALPRGFHSARDTRSRIDLTALNSTVQTLLKLARRIDHN